MPLVTSREGHSFFSYSLHCNVTPWFISGTLIRSLACAVTNETSDRAWLSPLALPATAVLERPCEAVADLGYDHGAAVQACLEAGITPSIARPITAANKQLGLFSTEDVRYDGATDTSQCPAGEQRTCRLDTVAVGRYLLGITT